MQVRDLPAMSLLYKNTLESLVKSSCSLVKNASVFLYGLLVQWQNNGFQIHWRRFDSFTGRHKLLGYRLVGLRHWSLKSVSWVRISLPLPSYCGISLVAKHHPSKLKLRVRFSHPAPNFWDRRRSWVPDALGPYSCDWHTSSNIR